jgi:hypothetical protein
MKHIYKIGSNGKVISKDKSTSSAPNTPPFLYNSLGHGKPVVKKPEDGKNITTTTVKSLGGRKVTEYECTEEQGQPLVPIASAPTHFLQKEGYYLSYNQGKCLFMRASSGKATQGNKLPTVLKKPVNGCGGGIHSVKASYTPPEQSTKPLREVGDNLTLVEYQNILSSRPSIASLLDAYDNYSQTELDIDTNKATVIF